MNIQELTFSVQSRHFWYFQKNIRSADISPYSRWTMYSPMKKWSHSARTKRVLTNQVPWHFVCTLGVVIYGYSTSNHTTSCYRFVSYSNVHSFAIYIYIVKDWMCSRSRLVWFLLFFTKPSPQKESRGRTLSFVDIELELESAVLLGFFVPFSNIQGIKCFGFSLWCFSGVFFFGPSFSKLIPY